MPAPLTHPDSYYDVRQPARNADESDGAYIGWEPLQMKQHAVRRNQGPRARDRMYV
jgi:hypothetical protein